MNLSFAGCGFLGIYHVGVAVCFKKYAPHLLLDKISGASAGCLAATCLLCDMPLGEYQNYFSLKKNRRSERLVPKNTFVLMAHKINRHLWCNVVYLSKCLPKPIEYLLYAQITKMIMTLLSFRIYGSGIELNKNLLELHFCLQRPKHVHNPSYITNKLNRLQFQFMGHTSHFGFYNFNTFMSTFLNIFNLLNSLHSYYTEKKKQC